MVASSMRSDEKINVLSNNNPEMHKTIKRVDQKKKKKTRAHETLRLLKYYPDQK